MDEFNEVPLKQLLEDWRHRDLLTWQMPTVLVVVGGVLVAEAFKLPNGWVRNALLLFGFSLSASLTLALTQNLLLQNKTKKRIQKKIQDYDFPRLLGSSALWLLSAGISVFLAVICWTHVNWTQIMSNPMFNGGNATIYVSNVDRAVRFYTETLGLRLQDRFGYEWVSIDAGNGLILSLQSTSKNNSSAGKSGSISIGFNVTEPLDQVVAKLKNKGVKLNDPVQGDPRAPIPLAFFADPDGNDLYLYEGSKNW